MFLYKLEIQGFKSFCDRTDLLFGDGITGVIGPNGCGKTNVSDAIRWAPTCCAVAMATRPPCF